MQSNFLDTAIPPTKERQHLVFELSPGEPPNACFVATLLIGERSGEIQEITPGRILADRTYNNTSHIMAKLLGGADACRTPIAPVKVSSVLGLLARIGKARWHANGKTLIHGADRSFQADVPPSLPLNSAIILGDSGPWYVDGATGEVGRVRLHQTLPLKPKPTAPIRLFRQNPKRQGPLPVQRSATTPTPRFTTIRSNLPHLRKGRPGRRPSQQIIAAPEFVSLEYPLVAVLHLRRVECPDDLGNMQHIDALAVDFDYGGTLSHADDERQFVRSIGPSDYSDDKGFVRRNRKGETAVLNILREDGFSQMRITDGPTAKGRMVFVFRGRDAAERWQGFLTQRVPALRALGWRCEIDRDLGPRQVQSVGNYDVRVTDAETGKFSLNFGIEIDGARIPLLPILYRLLDRGGIDAAQVIDGELITSLDDGRILKLPADRIRRLLAVMSDLIDAANRSNDGSLLLANAEVTSVLELEDLLTTRWENAAAINAYAQRYRSNAEIPAVVVPPSFSATLRPYQQQGVDWLQNLRTNDLDGFLADDMGLGKTIQIIAHIVVEQTAGRLDRPALIVVPTSLVTNWATELAKFAPHLDVQILHGLDRHARRAELADVHVVITTYNVLSRDIEEMKLLPWHLVVLDEAQVIKNPDSKSTKAVCQLDTRHRICLSGTPIENNLQELWSEFAFLMPGLLGDRKGFTKRFRTPIEKNNDVIRRAQLIRRIKPFLLRRTKSQVATDLPPKHTILRRINLAPAQRELYETIRGTLYDKVREQIAELTPARSRIIVLDALLKLRQVCCDPRLVKIPSARLVNASSKLDNLLEMTSEMIAEGRRILLFSQFTSMLDLIKPRLTEVGIKFVELRGDTRNRAEPVRVFENGDVPLFLISLKAGGQGLNLTSADTVIHYDPWWNPAAEDQASDRAHRIGQTKPVFVYKLIAADTVEDRILDLQQRKASLANIALGEEDGSISGIEMDDLEFLFGTSEKSQTP